MNKMWEMFNKGAFTIRITTLGVLGICAYMWINHIPLPDTLDKTWTMLMVFWFASEATKAGRAKE